MTFHHPIDPAPPEDIDRALSRATKIDWNRRARRHSSPQEQTSHSGGASPQSGSSLAQPAQSDWPDPKPLTNEPPVPFLLDRAFPPALSELRDYLTALAESLQVPVDMPAMIVLGIVASAIAKKAEVQLAEGYREPAPLWMLVLMPPAERKSASFQALLAPLFQWESAEAARLQPVIIEQQEQARLDAARIDELRRQLSESPNDQDVRQVLLALSQSSQAVRALQSPRLVANDATTEALASLMLANGERALIASPEGEAFENMMGRYSRGVPNLNRELFD